MKRPLPRLLVVITIAALGGSALAWHAVRERRQWAALRPAVPPPDGLAAPGLDARLAAAARRFAAWPPDRAALADFARLCHANGHLEEAMAAYRALIVLEPGEARWPHNLAAILAGYGRTDEAAPLLRRATALAPDHVAGWVQLGNVLLKSNASGEAATAFQEALRREEGDPYALLGLARCDLQEGRLTAARADLQHAVRIHPEFPAAASLLATVYERLGNPEAAANARSLVRHDGRYSDPPDPWTEDELLPYCHSPYLLLMRAHAAITNLEPRRALPPIDRALALAPQDAHLHRLKGRALFDLHDITGAREELATAVHDAPADEVIQLEWTKFLRANGTPEEYAAAVNAALNACPGSAALHVETAVLAVQAGHADAAAEHFARAWELLPDEPAAAIQLAVVRFGQRRDDDAIAVLEQVLARFPKNPDALRLLVRHGLERRDARTGGWLHRAIAAGEPAGELDELRQNYQSRFGAPLP